MINQETIFILYGIIAAMFLAVLFCIVFSIFNKKVLSKLNINLKLLFYTISITFLMVFFVVYFCFSATNFSVAVYLIICGVFLIYTLIILLAFYILLKPVRDLENITNELALGKRNTEIELFGAKEFDNIETNLIGVQNNYKLSDKKLNRKDYEYQKYLPSEYMKLLNKTNVEDIDIGDSVQKNVTVMFCDVRDSFFSSGTMNLEENFKVINNFLGLVGKQVRKHNGFVDKFMGDGVLAVFEKEEDAIKSATAICEKIDYQNLIMVGVNKINFGIAIHTGSVMVGVVGEEKRKSATIISDAVNLVSKVEHLNKLFRTKILFTKDTLNGVDMQNVCYRYIGTIQFNDLTESIPLFECLDAFKGVEKNALIKTIKTFESAVRSFEKEDYADAKKLFIQVLKNYNDDYLSKFYLAKCNEKLMK